MDDLFVRFAGDGMLNVASACRSAMINLELARLKTESELVMSRAKAEMARREADFNLLCAKGGKV